MQQERTPGAEKETICSEPHLSTLTQSTAFLSAVQGLRQLTTNLTQLETQGAFQKKTPASLSTFSQFINLKLIGIFFCLIFSWKYGPNLSLNLNLNLATCF